MGRGEHRGQRALVDLEGNRAGRFVGAERYVGAKLRGDVLLELRRIPIRDHDDGLHRTRKQRDQRLVESLRLRAADQQDDASVHEHDIPSRPEDESDAARVGGLFATGEYDRRPFAQDD